MKTVEYSLKPGETKEIAIVDSKTGNKILVKSSQKGVPHISKVGGLEISASDNGFYSNQPPAANDDNGKRVVPAKTNWFIKKDGKDAASGNDAFEYTASKHHPERRYNLKYHADITLFLEPGTYFLSIKCVQEKPCEDKVEFGYSAGSTPDATNLEP